MTDTYCALTGGCRREIKVRGSRFLAEAHPVEDAGQAEEILSAVRKTYHDATHHCFAFRVGTDSDTFRFSDDGEPAGTAGKPILAAIDREGLSDTLVVVTRYFGGVKLGTGGLARAYAEAAALVLHDAPKQTRYVTLTMEVSFSYDLTGVVMHALSQFQARVLETRHDEETHLTIEARRSSVEELARVLVDQSRGKTRVERVK